MNLINLKERIAFCEDFSKAERSFILEAINAAIPRSVATDDIHVPKNHLSRIDCLWAFLSSDEGGEGIIAAPFGEVTMPLLAADEARLTSLRPIARLVAMRIAKPVLLVRFSERTVLEEISDVLE